MRTLLGLILVVVLAVVVASYLGLINIGARGGALPKVEASGGSLPKVDVETAKVKVGTTNTSVTVPTVKTEEKKVEVPKVSVEKPAQANP